MGAGYATGFSTTTSTTTSASNANAANVFGQSAVVPNSLSPYAGLVTNPANVGVSFDGLWGVVSADALVFKVDLSGLPGGQTFYTDIYLKNFSSVNPWSAEQFKWLQFDCTAADPVGSDYTAGYAVAATNVVGDAKPKLMNVTAADAHVSFASLAGAKKYCFLIHSATPHADDNAGTFLTRPDTSAAPGAPQFTAVVNRSA